MPLPPGPHDLGSLPPEELPVPLAATPLERLRFDPADLPPPRQSASGSIWCYACDRVLAGDGLLCDNHKAQMANINQQRRRDKQRKTFPVSRAHLVALHEGSDAIAPLIHRLTVAYNNGGNLRDEVNDIMLHVKHLQSKIMMNLPDPRRDESADS